MPDWNDFVRRHLSLPNLTHEREEQIREDLALQFEQAYHDALSRGLSAAEAETAARAHVPDWESFTSDVYRSERRNAKSQLDHWSDRSTITEDAGGIMNRWLNDLRQDVLYGLRTLRKSRGFTVVAVVTLALGIGANTVMFSVLNGVVLKPPPYPEPDRVVFVYNTYKDIFDRGVLSPGLFYDWKQVEGIFDGFSPVQPEQMILTESGEPVEAIGRRVAPDFFAVMGMAPVLGRGFSEEETIPGNEKVVVLTNGLWRERFGGNEDALGKTLTLNGDPYEVIGVLPEDFRYPYEARYWLPFAPSERVKNQRRSWYLSAVARLKSGVTPRQAVTALETRMRQLEEQYPNYEGRGANVMPIHEEQISEVKSNIWMLLGAVAFVLLIACVNIANLLLSRATGREKEFSLRAAMGAPRSRLLRQMLTESLLLASLGGVLGFLFGWLGVRLFVVYRPPFFPKVEDISIDLAVLGFSLAATLVTGLLFGLAPALQAGRTDLVANLKGGRNDATGRRRNWLRNGLVVSEVALAMMLLVGAGLLVRSFANLLSEPIGFESEKLLMVHINLPQYKYGDRELRDSFFDSVLQRLHQDPRVVAAGGITALPFSGWNNKWSFRFPELEDAEGNPRGGASMFAAVTPGYFQTLGIPLRRGRTFTDDDGAKAPPVAIVSESLAKQYLGDTDPLGKILVQGRTEREIVGVVGDVRHLGLDTEPEPTYYIPFRQQAETTLMVVARTMGPTSSLAAEVRSTVQTLDPEQPVAKIETVESLISETVAVPRFYMMLLTLFASLAAVLAAVGIYGVMGYSVEQRTREIGIRMALGARRTDVLGLILRRGTLLAAGGVVLGLTGAWILNRIMEGLVYKIDTTDPATFAGISLLLLATALLACWVPARRATRVDPMVALRYE